MVRSGGKVSLTIGNWIGLGIICAILLTAWWKWTSDISAKTAANTEAIKGLTTTVNLIAASVVKKTEEADGQTQANAGTVR